jgi:hypothetical protein
MPLHLCGKAPSIDSCAGDRGLQTLVTAAAHPSTILPRRRLSEPTATRAARGDGGGVAISPSLQLPRSGAAAAFHWRDLAGTVAFRGSEWLVAQIRGCPDRILGLRVRGARAVCGGRPPLLGGGGSLDRRGLVVGGDVLRRRPTCRGAREAAAAGVRRWQRLQPVPLVLPLLALMARRWWGQGPPVRGNWICDGAPAVLLDDGFGLAPPWWWGWGPSGACWWCRGGASSCAGLLPVKCCGGGGARTTALVEIV